jgi:hypothetical protein
LNAAAAATPFVAASAGGITSLVKLYGSQHTPGTDWAASSSSSDGGSSSSSGSSSGGSSSSSSGSSSSSSAGGVLAQIRYSAYCEASYQFIWKYYAWQLPLPW